MSSLTLIARYCHFHSFEELFLRQPPTFSISRHNTSPVINFYAYEFLISCYLCIDMALFSLFVLEDIVLTQLDFDMFKKILCLNPGFYFKLVVLTNTALKRQFIAPRSATITRHLTNTYAICKLVFCWFIVSYPSSSMLSQNLFYQAVMISSQHIQ